jgi:putative ABC transport system permease protein
LVLALTVINFKKNRYNLVLSNYFKIAWRNLLSHKFYTLLNVLGLSLGMTTCLTVILIIRDQYSYDRFHANGEQVFRINSIAGDSPKAACAPYPLGQVLLNDFSVAESETRLVRNFFGVDATTSTNLTLPMSGYFAEPSFFDMFGFALESGNPATALAEPNTLVLSQRMAEKLFGKENPIGQSLTLKNRGGAYRVTGVMAKPKGKSHLTFDCLASAKSLEAIEAALPVGAEERVLDNWADIYSTHVYVRLAAGKTKADLENALTIAAETRNKTAKPEEKVQYFAQNLSKISPQPEMLSNDPSPGAPMFFIWGMGAFMVLLLLFPCLNYANMAVARALTRTREVGVRKAIGARNSDVRVLFLTEAMLTSGLALVLSVVLHWPLNNAVGKYFPAFTDLKDLAAKPLDWLIFIGLALAVGLFAGWIPAKRLSKLDPSLAIRGDVSRMDALKPASRRFNMRSVVLVGQFAFSLIFMILVATIWSQMRFMTLADYGFNKENLLNIQLQGNKADILVAELKQLPQVAGTASASILLASNHLQGMDLRKERGSENLGVYCVSVGHDYLSLMDLQLLAGENFPADASPDRLQYLVINEKAVEEFQLGSPAQAVGQTLWVSDTASVVVSGVVRDFHYRAMQDVIEPFALRFAPNEQQLLHVKLAAGDPGQALTAIESVWKKIDPVHSFQAVFMQESVERAYGGVAFAGGLISFFSFIALSLAFLGLLASVTHSMGIKVKEIGIRKVLGASVSEVALFLSRRFLVILCIAIVLALPAGYALSNLFLTMFAYRISVGGLILGGCSVLLIAIGLATVGIQSLKAAVANPVKSLRSE